MVTLVTARTALVLLTKVLQKNRWLRKAGSTSASSCVLLIIIIFNNIIQLCDTWQPVYTSARYAWKTVKVLRIFADRGPCLLCQVAAHFNGCSLSPGAQTLSVVYQALSVALCREQLHCFLIELLSALQIFY